MDASLQRSMSIRHCLGQWCTSSVYKTQVFWVPRSNVAEPFVRATWRFAPHCSTTFVSPAEIPIYAGRYLFRRSAFLKGFSLGVLALRRASPAFAASVSSHFSLQGLHSKRQQLSFLQRCAASVARRLFVGYARLQGGAHPFGRRV